MHLNKDPTLVISRAVSFGPMLTANKIGPHYSASTNWLKNSLMKVEKANTGLKILCQTVVG